MKAYVGSAAGLVLVAAVIQALTLIRTLQLSAEFGASARLDAFYLAMNFTVVVFSIVAPAVSTVLVPELVKGRRLGQLGGYLRWLGLVTPAFSTLVLLVVAVGGNRLFDSPDPGAGAPFFPLVGILMLGQQFRVVTAVYTAVLQARESFLPSRLLMVLPAAAPVVALLVTDDLVVVCVALTVSYALESVGNWVLGRTDRSGDESADSEASKLLVTNTLPIIGSSAIFQLQVLVLVIVVAQFGEGMVTIYNNAMQFVSFGQVLILQNLILMAYPRLSKWVSGGREDDLDRVAAAISLGVWASWLVVVGYFAVGEAVVTLLLRRGEFDAAATWRVYVFAGWLVLLFPLGTVRDFLYRILYARGESMAAARNSIIVVAIGLGSLPGLLWTLGVNGVFAMLALSAGVSVFGGHLAVRRNGVRLPARSFVGRAAVSSAAGLACVGVCSVVARELGMLAGWRYLMVSVAVAAFLVATAKPVFADIRTMRGN